VGHTEEKGEKTIVPGPLEVRQEAETGELEKKPVEASDIRIETVVMETILVAHVYFRSTWTPKAESSYHATKQLVIEKDYEALLIGLVRGERHENGTELDVVHNQHASLRRREIEVSLGVNSQQLNECDNRDNDIGPVGDRDEPLTFIVEEDNTYKERPKRGAKTEELIDPKECSTAQDDEFSRGKVLDNRLAVVIVVSTGTQVITKAKIL